MKLYFCLTLFFVESALCNVINNVRLVNHADYIINVLTETVQAIERRGWSNMKLPDITVDVNEVVLNWNATGTIRYTNGFVVSMQQVDIQQSTVQQVWTFNNTDQATTVSVRGTLRLHSVTIGYDVLADLEDGSHRFSTSYTHPLLSFAFSINRNIQEESFLVTVVGTVPRVTTVRPVVLPQVPEHVADFLTTHFNPELTAPGINAWGQEIFEPITLNVVQTQVQFPELCYNCPVS